MKRIRMLTANSKRAGKECPSIETDLTEEYLHINLHINPAQTYAAPLAYCHANRDEIDREFEAEDSDFLSDRRTEIEALKSETDLSFG